MIKKLLLGTTLLTLTLTALTATAQSLPSPPQSLVTSQPKPEVPPLTIEERYLILTDTSSGMRKIAKPCRQAVFDLVHWGADGHMVTGDTYGLWTFNEDAYPGSFPMQVWTPDHKLTLASRASLHLAEQPYENSTRMNAVMLKLLAIVLKVEDVNFFVITDGSSPLVGLPFEKELQAACAEREEERKKAKKPFVISLIARGGIMTDWSVVIAGEPLILPARRPRPVEVVKAEVPLKPEQKPSGKVISMRTMPPKRVDRPHASPNASPLIMTGTPSAKPEGTTPPATIPARPRETAQIPAPAKPAAATQLSAVVQPSAGAQPPAAAQPPVVAQSAPAPTVPPAVAPAPPASPPNPAPPKATTASTPAPPSAGVLTVAARDKAPGYPAHPHPPMQAAIVPNPKAELTLSARQLFLAGGLLLLTAIAIGFAFIRRLHPVPQPSFITQSMENPS